MDDIPAIRNAFIKSGYSLNKKGGFYRNGVAKTLEEKAAIARTYVAMKEREPRTSIGDLAKAVKISKNLASKIVKELNNGRLLDPKDNPQHRARGKGSKTLSLNDEWVLLRLRVENNQRPLIDYQQMLEQITGTLASKTTINDWFLYANPFKGGCRALNKVPLDKFKPENLERAIEYIQLIYQMNPFRLKFCDEAHLKGGDLESKRGRRCPMTGVVEPVLVSSDFRNAYSIIGFCGIAPDTPPFSYVMHEETNDAEKFLEVVLNAVITGFLRYGDVLVMDNAAIHTGGAASALVDLLYEDHGISVLLLPTRSPELNPIEQMWHLLRERLTAVCTLTKNHGNDPPHHAAQLAGRIMSAFTHADVYACYYHSKYVH